jgi:hypothetical protein
MNMKKEGDKITGVSRIVKVEGEDDDNGEEGEVSEENANVEATGEEASAPVENEVEVSGEEQSGDAPETEAGDAEETEDKE